MEAKDVKFTNRPLTIGEWADFLLVRMNPDDPGPVLRLLASRADPRMTVRQVRSFQLSDMDDLIARLLAQMPEAHALMQMEAMLKKNR